MRVYQGGIRRGDSITNTRTGKKVKVSRLVRMHSDEMEVSVYVCVCVCVWCGVCVCVWVCAYVHWIESIKSTVGTVVLD